MRFEQQRHTAQERTGGKAAVCLATGVRVSCKRIRNAFKATVTLTWSEAGCLRPEGISTLDRIGDGRLNKGGRPRRIHLNRGGKARSARAGRAGELLRRHKVSKGRTTADLASLRAGEALTQGLLPLRGALP
jgi:hypothetical protein